MGERTTARINKEGKHFEILVDADDALKFKKGEDPNIEAEGDMIFRDSRKGEKASETELEDAFGTSDTNEIAQKIVKEGELLMTQEQRDAEREKKLKRVVDFLSKNGVDPRSGNPHSPDRIKSALDEAHVNIKNGPVESQINDIIQELNKVLPIKVETRRVKVTIPAMYAGKAYGVVNQYKEQENWLNDGSLEVTVNVPAGIIMDFYDKLNSATHGSALTEEIKEE
ncbi:MAG: ribosome assembly factor SBDS [Candidatus Pacearchaeota archaeon]